MGVRGMLGGGCSLVGTVSMGFVGNRRNKTVGAGMGVGAGVGACDANAGL